MTVALVGSAIFLSVKIFQREFSSGKREGRGETSRLHRPCFLFSLWKRAPCEIVKGRFLLETICQGHLNVFPLFTEVYSAQLVRVIKMLMCRITGCV